MGKRKRASDNHPQIDPSSDAMPCSSGMEQEEKRMRGIGSSELAGSSMKQQDADHPATADNPENSLGRSMFVRRSRNHFGHHYSRRGPTNLTTPSSSRGKSASRDERLSFKLAAHYNSELGRLAEFRERAFFQQDRIRSTALMLRDDMPTELLKLVCGICRKPLIQKFFLPEMGITTVDLKEVAVMACGHFYHVECLDLKTSFEDKRDPPCPSCLGSKERL